MTTQVQIRGNNKTTQEARTLVSRELDIDTTDKRLSVHDGSTVGGVKHANSFDLVNRTFSYASATGTNAIAFDLPVSPNSYQEGQKFSFKAQNNNTGAATINVNSLGAVVLKKINGLSVTDVSSDDILSGVVYDVVYDGAEMVLSSGSSGAGYTVQNTLDLNSGSTVSVTGLLPNKSYIIEFHNILTAVNSVLTMSVRKDGVSPVSGAYTYGVKGQDEVNTTISSSSASASSWSVLGSDSHEVSISSIDADVTFKVTLSNPNSAVLPKCGWECEYFRGGGLNRAATIKGFGSVRDSSFNQGFNELILTTNSTFVSGTVIVREINH